jgi:acyl-CoA thioesterase II
MLNPLSTTLLTASEHPADIVAGLVRLLTVAPAGEDSFLGPRKPGGVGRVFGGQVVAQALAAAQATVAAERPVHSLHAYFLRGGSEDSEIRYTVMRDMDARSFTNRRVVAEQDGETIFSMTASFHKREDGIHHTLPMPAVPKPEALPSETDLLTIYSERIEEAQRQLLKRPRAIEMRPVEPINWLRQSAAEPVAHTWFRCVAPLPDDMALHRAIIAYASDMTLLGTALLPHALSWAAGTARGASLDHAIWFHEDARADEWLLYACDSPWAGNARGLSRGRIFTRDGRLIAETAQEGLVRKVG